jgi:antitoxin component of MazEF toxin-antitoxin module
MSEQWTVYVEQKDDELILPLPDDVLAKVGWIPGDIITWEIQEDGTIILRKKERWYKKMWNKINSWRI